MTLPKPSAEREVTVTVVWPDGCPAVKASVDFEMSEGTSLGARANTDEKGMVTLKLFDNYSYVVYANAERSANTSFHSDPIEVLVDKKLKSLKFVLTKPGYVYSTGSQAQTVT